MGGEYLPNYGRQEVEIARIALASTTSDVISLRARPSGLRIKYTLVDEYKTEFQLPQETSSRPFSLRELIRFLDSVEQEDADPSWNRFGFVLSSNQCNLDCGTDLENLQDFNERQFRFLSRPRVALLPHDRGLVFGSGAGYRRGLIETDTTRPKPSVRDLATLWNMLWNSALFRP
jgi:hypothetical protein